MVRELKPFLMVINDETGDFVDIKKIVSITGPKDGPSMIFLDNALAIPSPLRPRDIWGRINIIRHKYGQRRRSNSSGSTTPFEKSVPAAKMDRSDSIPPKTK